MTPHIDIHLRITLTPAALAEFSTPLEAAEHAVQCICSNSGLVNAAIIEAPDLGEATRHIRAGLEMMERGFQQATSSTRSDTLAQLTQQSEQVTQAELGSALSDK